MLTKLETLLLMLVAILLLNGCQARLEIGECKASESVRECQTLEANL
jgi:uncharacterized lipoprotein YajG